MCHHLPKKCLQLSYMYIRLKYFCQYKVSLKLLENANIFFEAMILAVQKQPLADVHQNWCSSKFRNVPMKHLYWKAPVSFLSKVLQNSNSNTGVSCEYCQIGTSNVCNRTSCGQVHELPWGHWRIDNNREGTLSLSF